MNYKEHIVGGAALGIGGIIAFKQIGIATNIPIILIGSTVASLIPDIDHPNSYLGRRIPLISSSLYKTVGHRTLTHSIFFASTLGITTAIFIDINLGIAIVLGIMSHIILDLIGSKQGVAFLYPLNKGKIKL